MADDEAVEDDAWLYGEPVEDLKVPVEDPEYVSQAKGTKRKLEDDGEGNEGEGQAEETGAEGQEGNGDAVPPVEGIADDDNEDISDNADDDDDDSDDDGVQVVIGDIKGGQSSQSGSTFGAAPPAVKRPGPPPDKKGKFSAEDFDSSGTINGVPAQDFSLDSLEDKPWRKPGADITDYFNYGFTEDTWRCYCDRQKRLRFESGAGYQAGSGGQAGTSTDQKSGVVFPKKFNNPTGVRRDGLGQSTRREEPRENTIQVRVVMTADRREYGRKNFDMNMGPPMVPPPFNMNLPPPGFGPPPEFMGPEFFNHPPPGYYQEEEQGYDDQQWMDSQWEMGMDRGSGIGPSPSVVPLTKVAVVPPPPGESMDDDSSNPPPSKRKDSTEK